MLFFFFLVEAIDGKHLGHPVSSVQGNNLAKVRRSTAVLASLSGLSELHRGALSSRRTASGPVGPDGSQISWERTVLVQLEGEEPADVERKRKMWIAGGVVLSLSADCVS